VRWFTTITEKKFPQDLVGLMSYILTRTARSGLSSFLEHDYVLAKYFYFSVYLANFHSTFLFHHRAPDVYFEDDSVFNLTAELTRSKRIKCACCGVKGAALGCFDKSCRKSFHFTCAKLIPECRWDNVSILCSATSNCNFTRIIPQHFSKFEIATL
jgi:hypothetical protein